MANSLPLPANIPAERAVLGSILLDPELLTSLDLEPSDFHAERHVATYTAMRNLWNAGQPVDFVLLMDELERSGKGDIVTPTDLTALLDDTPTALYGAHYAGVVKRASIARQYVGMAQKLAEMALKEEDADTIYSWVMEKIAIINSGRTDDKALVLWDESFPLFRQILKQEQERQAQGEAGWTWPWDSWNELLVEAQPGMGAHFAGATGTGKTTFAECIAEHWARQGKKVVLVHLELNRKVMFARRMTRHTSIDVRNILSGNIQPGQQKLMDKADELMSTWVGNIHYLHAPGWSAERIVRELTKLHDQGQCEGYVVDYMQKLKASPSQIRMFKDNIYNRQADDMEQFKNLSEERELRQVTLGQLVKTGQDIRFENLTLEKLRGTQEVADKVNVVGLFHRETQEGGVVGPDGEYAVRPGGLDLTVRTRIDKNTLGEQGTIVQQIVPEMFNVF